MRAQLGGITRTDLAEKCLAHGGNCSGTGQRKVHVHDGAELAEHGFRDARLEARQPLIDTPLDDDDVRLGMKVNPLLGEEATDINDDTVGSNDAIRVGTAQAGPDPGPGTRHVGHVGPSRLGRFLP